MFPVYFSRSYKYASVFMFDKYSIKVSDGIIVIFAFMVFISYYRCAISNFLLNILFQIFSYSKSIIADLSFTSSLFDCPYLRMCVIIRKLTNCNV